MVFVHIGLLIYGASDFNFENMSGDLSLYNDRDIASSFLVLGH